MPGGSAQYHAFPDEHWNDKHTNLRAETPFTSPPLNDDFDAITQRWSRTTKATTVEPTCPGLYEQLEATTRATTPAVAGFSIPRRRKTKTSNGDVGDWVPRKQHTVELSAAAAQGRSLRRMRGKDRIKSGGVNGSAVGEPSLRRARVAPLAGQDFEMVEYRVLEDGVERTVSISTWREQAIQEADSDDDISVYWVNAEDCARLDGPVSDVVELPPKKENIGSGSNNSGHRSGESSREPQHPFTSAEKLAPFNGRPSTSRNNSGTKTHRSASKEAEASPSLHSSAPRMSTPRGSGTLVAQNADILEKISSPFHATKSAGSTISSIHSAPMPTLEHVLMSCQPSLMHISPILRRVGIVREEHLQAVGKLSEDTRNREVKDEVLKLGVTVMEWAILLDKLRSL
ncbi:hypothetical protein FB451DRAFT_1220798 [Mycena latifolia]|nr:hypothetical protein FB451DRAFT_1220798 [Mycena latifolia]